MIMSAPHLTISCDSYKNNIFYGLSRLQGRQEFVDLTLAADGHLVKVHKNIIALASPYLKDMIQALSTDNPVIFLNNVSHNVLTLLLEYIYQGEVIVPRESLKSFLQVAKSLHIIGMKQLNTPTDLTTENTNNETQAPTDLFVQQQTETGTEKPETCLEQVAPLCTLPKTLQLEADSGLVQAPSTNTFQKQLELHIESLRCSETLEEPNEDIATQPVVVSDGQNESAKNFAACITINNDHNIEVQQFAENLPDLTAAPKSYGDQLTASTVQESMPDIENMPVVVSNDMDVDTSLNDAHQEASNATSENSLLKLRINLDQESKDYLRTINQFSVTERGAAQIILHRFIYCSHHTSRGGRKHRWRCMDYRKLKCPAFVDTLDGRILLRNGLHKHEYHDEKIYEKQKCGKVFRTMEEAQASREPKISSIHPSAAGVLEDVEHEIEPNIIPMTEN